MLREWWYNQWKKSKFKFHEFRCHTGKCHDPFLRAELKVWKWLMLLPLTSGFLENINRQLKISCPCHHFQLGWTWTETHHCLNMGIQIWTLHQKRWIKNKKNKKQNVNPCFCCKLVNNWQLALPSTPGRCHFLPSIKSGKKRHMNTGVLFSSKYL